MSNDKNEKINEILSSLKDKKDGKSAEEYLLSQLSEEQSQKLKSIISNDESVKSFLSSEQAKKVIAKLMGKAD
jgi:hypothetical protein